MKEITIKYATYCTRCGKELALGNPAMYVKTTGIFCIGCQPTEPEEIRHFRMLKAQKKIERLERKAERLEQEAEKKMEKFNYFRNDVAFMTQPGYIPFRERVCRQYEKGLEIWKEKQKIESKIESLQNVRVKGDAERKYDQIRMENDQKIKIGDTIFSYIYGKMEVLKINKKTYTVKFPNNTIMTVDKALIKTM